MRTAGARTARRVAQARREVAEERRLRPNLADGSGPTPNRRAAGRAARIRHVMTDVERYLVALSDWLACATRGRSERAAQAAVAAGDGILERVAAAATAGHVLDFDDTWTPGL